MSSHLLTPRHASNPLFTEIGARARVLDRLLDDVLDLVPVVRVDELDRGLEELLDLVEH